MSVRAAVVVFASVVAGSCTSTKTSSVTAPTVADRCQVSVNSTAAAFTATGGSGTVAVSTARDCTWTATTDATWVAINGTRDGQGDGVVAFAVAANPAPSPRTGGIAVGSERVSVTQAAAPCRFTLSRSADTIGSSGGHLSVEVATLTGCNWTASSSQTWIAIASGQSGNANGTVGLSIAANTGGRRVGDVNVGDQTYMVNQDAAPAPPATMPPPPAPSPAPPSPDPAPSPAPPPSPSPAPTPPPPPQDVRLDGTAVMESQSCPDATFSVNGEHVVANRSTDYKGGKCGDLRTGRLVRVDGVKSGGTVTAKRIEFRKDEG